MRKTAWIRHLETSKPSPLGEGFVKCASNPSIYNLGTAENKLVGDLILPVLRERTGITERDIIYAAPENINVGEAVARLMRDHLGIPDAEGSEIILGSGISFIIERLGMAMCDENDSVLIPAPCYGAFEPDLHMCKAKVIYIDLDNLPPAPPENARLLILTNPGNPLGDLIENQDKLLQWAYQNPNLHVISDDVYALSNRKGQKYQSIAGRPDADRQRVHQCYGVSKDWALAGLHVGFFWTKNKELFKMMKLSCGTFSMSSDTQWIVARIFNDIELRDKIITTFQERLIHAEEVCVRILKEGGIKVRECENSLFVMIDLTDIAGESIEQELSVWRELMNKYEIHVLPGAAGFHMSTPGWYRVCFSFLDDFLIEGLNRLVRGIKEMRANK